MKPQVSLIVTDLDNTLYDWVAMWYISFSAMLEQLVAKSGLPREQLESEIQTIFQKHGTSEYSFVIEEIPSLKLKHPNEDLTVVYEDAIKAYRFARQSSLKLYPGVRETLEHFRQIGCIIVAFTESMGFYTMRRLKKLRLDGILDFVYSPPDHARPIGSSRYYEDEQYELIYTKQRFIPEGELKPNPDILLSIIKDDGIHTPVEHAIYVGDSLMKDVRMAQEAGIIDVHAKYGEATSTDAYVMLRRVTHWTKEAVEREKAIIAKGQVIPQYVLEHSFSELLNLMDFVPYIKHSRR